MYNSPKNMNNKNKYLNCRHYLLFIIILYYIVNKNILYVLKFQISNKSFKYFIV